MVKFGVVVFQKVNSSGNICVFFVELGRTVYRNFFIKLILCFIQSSEERLNSQECLWRAKTVSFHFII